MEDEVAEEEVSEGTLVRDVCELELVFGINLDAEADCSVCGNAKGKRNDKHGRKI